MINRWVRDFVRDMIQALVQYRSKSIIVKTIIFTFLVMIIPFFVMSTIVKMKMNDIVKDEIATANERMLETIGNSLDNVVDKMFSVSYFINTNESLTPFFLTELNGKVQDYSRSLEDRVSFNMMLEDYVDSVYIYASEMGNVVIVERGRTNIRMESIDNMSDVSWLSWYEKYAASSSFIFCGRQKKGFYPYLLTLIRPVSIGDGQNINGAVIVNVDMRKLSRYLVGDTTGEIRFYMLNEMGEICYTNQESYFEGTDNDAISELVLDMQCDPSRLVNVEGLDFDLLGRESEKYNLQYILCNSNIAYRNKIEGVNRYIINVVLVLIVLGLVLSCVVAFRSFFPIRKILQAISVLKEDEECLGQNSQKINEIDYITDKIKLAHKRDEIYQNETKKWVKKLNDAQMLALQSQINPHYLFNTMETINSIAIYRWGEDNGVSDMLTALADFFRIGMQREGYLVPILEEINHAKLYMKIMGIRYGNSIQVSWEIDKRVLAYKMISLTIQPLLENAIQHGLRKKRYQGHISVKGEWKDNFICFTIEDDGCGMALEDCVALNNELTYQYEKSTDHVGVRNVNQRIKILCGEDFGIHVSKREGGGLIVQMLLPEIC